MRSAEHNKDVAELIDGIPTAKNQNGIDAQGNPIKTSDNKTWQFGDSLADVKPTKIA